MEYTTPKKLSRFKDIGDRQNAYRQVFEGSDLGKLVLEDLLDECAINRTAFSKEGGNQTYLNLGKQLVGFHILKLLNIQLQEINND